MSTINSTLTQAQLKSVLSYNENTGLFTWIEPTSRRVKVGCVAGSHDLKGYLIVRVFRTAYKAHRLAWFYMNGEFPQTEIDHINQIKDDNRFENLRQCTHSENLQNVEKWSVNTSGYKGVNRVHGKWRAFICTNKKNKHLGLFENIDDAIKARMEAEKIMHTFSNQI